MSAMNYRTKLAEWAESKAVELSRCGSYTLRFSEDDRDNASGHLVLETGDGFVELIVWESGDAEFAFGPFQQQTDEHHEMDRAADLEQLLARFLEQARGLGSG